MPSTRALYPDICGLAEQSGMIDNCRVPAMDVASCGAAIVGGFAGVDGIADDSVCCG